MPSWYLLHNKFPQTGTLKICSEIFTRKLELNFGMRELFGHEKVSKKFGVNWGKINALASQSAIQDRIGNELIEHDGKHGQWNILPYLRKIWPKKNYENYLGILGVMEIKVASQPRAIWVIPLIEKEYSQ